MVDPSENLGKLESLSLGKRTHTQDSVDFRGLMDPLNLVQGHRLG